MTKHLALTVIAAARPELEKQVVSLAKGTILVGRGVSPSWASENAHWTHQLPTLDPKTARRHFEVIWDGKTARINAFKTTNGTTVNGGVVTDAVLHHGDVIQAGDSVFQVAIE